MLMHPSAARWLCSWLLHPGLRNVDVIAHKLADSNQFMTYLLQGHYYSGNPGKVRKLEIGQGNVLVLENCDWKLDGCIVWNVHNTVLGSKRSAICAQAVYFLHSTRPSVTWLNSRWWLTTCDWVMSALSAVLSTRVGRLRKFGEVSCVRSVHSRGMIPAVEMETRSPAERYFGSEFLAICNHCRVVAAWSHKTLTNLWEIFAFFLTKRPLKIFKILFWKVSSRRVVFKFCEIWPTGNR